MVPKKRFAIKALVILTTLVIVTNVLVPQLANAWRRYVTTSSSYLRQGGDCESQSTQQRNKDHSVFTLLPEMHQNTTLLIIINTVPSEVERRNILRQTWARQSSWSFAANSSNSLFHSGDVMKVTYFFMMGFDGDSFIDETVKKESGKYRDILRLNLTETYRGLVNKILLTFEWVTTLDIKPLFIAKADHDVYIKIPELARWLEKHSRTSSRLYAGFVLKNAPVKREVRSPWYVSKEDYNQDTFPPYCRGPFYVFSRDLFLYVVNASKVNKPFPVEDAYVGLLVQKIGVQPINTGRDLFNSHPILNHVVLNTPESQIKIPSGIVLGDSLSSAAVRLIHRVYMGSS